MSEWKGTYLRDWEELIGEIEWLCQKKRGSECTKVLPLLYRGVKNAERDLKTSLERERDIETSLEREWKQPAPVMVSEYFKLITKLRPEIESVTNRNWEDVPDYPGYDDWINKFGTPGRLPAPPGYGYLAYLRHNDFPSPFLDWSRSPYVAAYFAFARANEDQKEPVSIYVYWKTSDDNNNDSSGKPTIHGFGPHIRTHRRHFRQQSEYTICINKKGKDAWEFASHRAAITPCDGLPESEVNEYLSQKVQNLAWKFNLPASEKWKVLKYLDDHNINGFSLFDTEDEFMNTLALRARLSREGL